MSAKSKRPSVMRGSFWRFFLFFLPWPGSDVCWPVGEGSVMLMGGRFAGMGAGPAGCWGMGAAWSFCLPCLSLRGMNVRLPPPKNSENDLSVSLFLPFEGVNIFLPGAAASAEAVSAAGSADASADCCASEVSCCSGAASATGSAGASAGASVAAGASAWAFSSALRASSSFLLGRPRFFFSGLASGCAAAGSSLGAGCSAASALAGSAAWAFAAGWSAFFLRPRFLGWASG